jgi:type II secretion system protein G
MGVRLATNPPKGARASRAFTLIELLIVVAIIAILAAIAVPNFLEAQVRSKVSRAKADMRSVATALEAYRTDFNRYPADGVAYNSTFGTQPYQGVAADAPVRTTPLLLLTTPVAYITSVPREPFTRQFVPFWYPSAQAPMYGYVSVYTWIGNTEAWQLGPTPLPGKRRYEWCFDSVGPDRYPGGGSNLAFGLEYAITRPPADMTLSDNERWGGGVPNLYDPTNGTVSWGDIARAGP